MGNTLRRMGTTRAGCGWSVLSWSSQRPPRDENGASLGQELRPVVDARKVRGTRARNPRLVDFDGAESNLAAIAAAQTRFLGSAE
jgi:hypothetical protein